MEPEFERFDISILLETYMKESKEFSTALEQGASWDSLEKKRLRIRLISALINKKYDELYGAHRLRNKPPHGD